MTRANTYPARPLDILYVGTLPPYPGGSAISGSLLLVGLAARGNRVRAIAPIAAPSLAAGDGFAARHPSLEVTRFIVPRFDFDHTNPAGDDDRRREGEQIRQRVRALIAVRRPDIILVGREPFLLHVGDIAAAESIPCVLRAAGGTTLQIAQGRFPRHLTLPLLEKYRQADMIISPAEHLAASLRALGMEHVRVIPNAVDPDQFTPAAKDDALRRALQIPERAFVALHASNLVSSKQPLDLVAAAARVVRQRADAVYVVVGDGPLRQAMDDACREAGIASHFRFTGWVDYERMPAYLNLADVVVMPADAETQARTYLEAQACGRLLLASDIPGAREVVEDGRSALLFRPGDIDELTAKTLLAAGDASLRRTLGRNARAHVLQAHSLDRAVTAYLETLGTLIAAPRDAATNHDV